MTSIEYAKKCCDTIMNKYRDAELPPAHMFHYHAGVFLSGMERTYLLCGEEKYNAYIKKWINRYVDENGNITGVDDKTLDDIEPCNLLIRYVNEGEKRYKKVLDLLTPKFLDWKCNIYGGFWHKEYHPDQMWLDSLYMAGPLAVRYGLLTGQDEYIKLIKKQLLLMWNNMRDKDTGLLYHAWDVSRKADWADNDTGCSPEVWGRAVGWYLVAAADISEMLPEGSDDQKCFEDCAVKLGKSLLKFQDERTGMWYQVVDKGGLEGNWIETSCSCLFTYGLANLIRRGILEAEYITYVDKAYNGIIEYGTRMLDSGLIVKNICIGTGVGDYNYYINRDVAENDLHGAGAFTLMCTEYYKMKQKLTP
jgi:unsaturated rhamnogalacturonyl hydrolase